MNRRVNRIPQLSPYLLRLERKIVDRPLAHSPVVLRRNIPDQRHGVPERRNRQKDDDFRGSDHGSTSAGPEQNAFSGLPTQVDSAHSSRVHRLMHHHMPMSGTLADLERPDLLRARVAGGSEIGLRSGRRAR